MNHELQLILKTFLAISIKILNISKSVYQLGGLTNSMIHLVIGKSNVDANAECGRIRFGRTSISTRRFPYCCDRSRGSFDAGESDSILFGFIVVNSPELDARIYITPAVIQSEMSESIRACYLLDRWIPPIFVQLLRKRDEILTEFQDWGDLPLLKKLNFNLRLDLWPRSGHWWVYGE